VGGLRVPVVANADADPRFRLLCFHCRKKFDYNGLIGGEKKQATLLLLRHAAFNWEGVPSPPEDTFVSKAFQKKHRKEVPCE